MRTELIHHPVGVCIRVATAEANQMYGLTSERIHDLAGYVVSAFHEVGDDDTVPDSLSSVRPKKALQHGCGT
jgi:hypothetical protein